MRSVFGAFKTAIDTLFIQSTIGVVLSILIFLFVDDRATQSFISPTTLFFQTIIMSIFSISFYKICTLVYEKKIRSYQEKIDDKFRGHNWHSDKGNKLDKQEVTALKLLSSSIQLLVAIVHLLRITFLAAPSLYLCMLLLDILDSYKIQKDTVIDSLYLIPVGAIALAIYLAPYFISKHRNHHNSTAIFLTVFLLGWTALGWIVAFIWSFTATRPIEEAPKNAVLVEPSDIN